MKLLPTANSLIINIDPSKYASVSKSISTLWRKVEPSFPVRIRSLNVLLAGLITKYNQLELLFLCFTVASVTIAVMGIFNISSYIIDQKKKEVSVRKVLGASLNGIWWLLIRQFILVSLLSDLVVWPLSVLIVKNWLNSFAFKIDLHIFPFVFSLIISFLITGAIVSTTIWKSAQRRVIDTLRYE